MKVGKVEHVIQENGKQINQIQEKNSDDSADISTERGEREEIGLECGEFNLILVTLSDIKAATQDFFAR